MIYNSFIIIKIESYYYYYYYYTFWITFYFLFDAIGYIDVDEDDCDEIAKKMTMMIAFSNLFVAHDYVIGYLSLMIYSFKCLELSIPEKMMEVVATHTPETKNLLHQSCHRFGSY